VVREDDSRPHAGPRGENLTRLRNLAIRLRKQAKSSDASLKTQRLRWGWDDDSLAKVLATTSLEDA
jgi:hypothetical protein